MNEFTEEIIGIGGFPHSEIVGSKLAHSSPTLIAACHVLHRLYMPRHPRIALTSRLRVHTTNDNTGLDFRPTKTRQSSEAQYLGADNKSQLVCSGEDLVTKVRRPGAETNAVTASI